jgi:hypothetical protein
MLAVLKQLRDRCSWGTYRILKRSNIAIYVIQCDGFGFAGGEDYSIAGEGEQRRGEIGDMRLETFDMGLETGDWGLDTRDGRLDANFS